MKANQAGAFFGFGSVLVIGVVTAIALRTRDPLIEAYPAAAKLEAERVRGWNTGFDDSVAESLRCRTATDVKACVLGPRPRRLPSAHDWRTRGWEQGYIAAAMMSRRCADNPQAQGDRTIVARIEAGPRAHQRGEPSLV